MILNLTQHRASPEQLAAGVVDAPAAMQARLSALLTFDALPTSDEVSRRAHALAQFALEAIHVLGGVRQPVSDYYGHAMIGGAPFFMAPLERSLLDIDVLPVYAFSTRQSDEVVGADGTVTKTTVFRHLGFVEACQDSA